MHRNGFNNVILRFVEYKNLHKHHACIGVTVVERALDISSSQFPGTHDLIRTEYTIDIAIAL